MKTTNNIKEQKMTEVKKFKVYHTRNWALNTKLHFDTEGYVPIKYNYELVAVVNGLDVEQAFHFTNHIDKSWFEHLNVEVVKESRSTSVGDLVEDEDGQLWFCAGCGWEKVEWSEVNDYEVHKDEYGEFLVAK
jgi:hypothetical protein